MSLSRQLVLILSLMFSLVFVGTFAVTIDNTRRFLITQLGSHAQDTATALGLSLSPPMVEGDVLLMESMIDAVFDHGYYREIVVESIDGDQMIDRVLPVRVQGVPDWFIRWLPLTTPKASAHVMAGWRRGGAVHVASHPGYAYRELWSNASHTFWWSMGTLAFSILLMIWTLRMVLRPLKAVEAQADAIAQREFTRLEPIPRTRELRRVVVAMNGMAGKLESILAGLSNRVRDLRDQAYSDALTGLGNRRAFERHLLELVGRSEEHAFGACLLIDVAGLDAVNEAHGYEGGDELITTVARRLREVVGETAGVIARLGGGMFAMVLPDLGLDGAKRLAAGTSAALAEVTVRDLPAAGATLGLAFYNGEQSPEGLRAGLENALRDAQEAGVNQWRVFARDDVDAAARVHAGWEEMLRRVIGQRRVVLFFQAVKSADLSSVLHHEVLARVHGADGELKPAGAFLAVAKGAGLAMALDRLIVEEVLEHLRRVPDADVSLAVNLAPASVHNRQFVTWLSGALESEPGLARRLSFEVTASGASRDPENVLELARRLHRLGARFGLDHFGVGDLSFDYVCSLKMDYTKIDGAFIRGVEDNLAHRGFVEGCVEVGRGTDVQVIAEMVENEAELATLHRLGLDGVQGYLVGRPAPWGEG